MAAKGSDRHKILSATGDGFGECSVCGPEARVRRYTDYRTKKKSWRCSNVQKRWSGESERRAFKGKFCCIVCGEDEPVCLDFHHRDPATKLFSVSTWWKSKREGPEGKKALMDEIAKCDVLCANCHRKRHLRERQDRFGADLGST